MDFGSVVTESLQQMVAGEDVENANNVLKQAGSDPQFLIALLQNLTENPNPEVRNLATIILRRRLVKAWDQLTDQDKQVFSTQILMRLEQEPVHNVRLCVAHCVSACAKVQYSVWKGDLMRIVESLLSQSNSQTMEVGVTVLQGLFDHISADEMRSYFAHTVQACQAGLRSNEAGLTSACVRLVECLAGFATSKEEIGSLQGLVAPLIEVGQKSMMDDSSDLIQFVIELLSNLAEGPIVCPEAVPALLTLIVSTMTADIEIGIKLQSVHLLRQLCRKRSKLIVAIPGAVDGLLDAILTFGSTPSDVDATDSEETHPWTVAGEAIDSMCTLLPVKHVYPSVMQRLQARQASQNHWDVHMAFFGLGAIAEGSSVQMTKDLPNLIPLVLDGIQSKHQTVRSAACVAISNMAVYLQPEITTYGIQAYKALMTCLKKECEENSAIQNVICVTLEMFLTAWDETPTDDLIPLMEESLTLFSGVLQKASNDPERVNVVDAVLGAIGSLAAACKHAIVPFLPSIVEMLQQKVRSPVASTRNKAMWGMAHILSSMDQETYMPYQSKFQDPILDILTSLAPQDHSESLDQPEEDSERHEAREACYAFLAALAGVLKEDFGGLVKRVGPWLLASLLSGDGVKPIFDDQLSNLADLDEGDSIEDFRHITQFAVDIAALEEQQAALRCLSAIFENVPIQHTTVLLEKTLMAADNLCQAFDGEVRRRVVDLLKEVMVAIHKGYPPMWLPKELLSNPEALYSTALRMWKPGISPCPTPLTCECQALWLEKVWPIFDERLQNEDDKEVVTDVLLNVGGLLEAMGPGLLCQPNIVDRVFTTIEAILSNAHACQDDDEVELDDEDVRVIEERLHVDTANLLAAVAQVIGPQFESFFERIQPQILTLARNKALSYMGVGAYAEVVRYLGVPALKYVEPVLPIAVSNLRDEEVAARRNSYYFLGNLADLSKINPMVPGLTAALEEVVPINAKYLEESYVGNLKLEEAPAVDNAASCLGRILQALPHEKCPVDLVVPAFLSALPLKDDFDETLPVISTLIAIFTWPVFSQVEKHLQTTIKASVLCLIHPEMRKNATVESWSSLEVIMKNVIQRLGINHPTIQALVGDDELAGSPKAVALLESSF